ncbi:zinc-dependent metalloprotease [Lacinutrix jangbogonensis]|uniref:zinc-dependent metalloprotease n=1 Tax=Lacinutrix jangbogonensis TaxID=1469557 RepID=UPI0006894593|nr:zinc-dependent metalloprotease family protein [Lacinutrix jangbogonensis]
MNKNHLLLLILIPIIGFSQGESFWTSKKQDELKNEKILEKNIEINSADYFSLDLQSLKNKLDQAPHRSSNTNSTIFVNFPTIEGKTKNYNVYNASILEENLANNNPEIQSYVGMSQDGSGDVIRFSTTIFGFHGAIYSIGNTYFIDPYSEDLKNYVFYAKKNVRSKIDRLGCEVIEVLENKNEDTSIFNKNADDGTLRIFRLALSCTQEYANYHINAAGQSAASDAVKRATVLAAMNVTMTRVNGLFERDMALTMVLVDNASIIFLAENDGFTDGDPSALINENQIIIDANIGTANYDIGHVFTTGGGGVAALGGICYSNAKAGGVTGTSNPVGDLFDVDFVAHEIGHQFGANHTFNGGQGNCSGGNRSATTAVEPGSGTTIMAYAGTCGSDNIQESTDDHFHAISIAEIWTRITPPGEPTCSTNTPNGNTAPVVSAGNDYTIPYGTAFTLSGTANDVDGTTLSYCWEQTDVGISTNIPSTTNTTEPQFRSYTPMTTGDRTFPQLSDILDNNLTPTWEVMPNVVRTMDFALTVRDNGFPNGGQTSRDDMTVTLVNTGPFRITAPDTTNESFSNGSSTTITWDVAGTTANGINTSNVNILLSTDGGLTFPTTLASNTANDGTELVTFPTVLEPYCRIKIEAVGNIFFAISKSFSVGATVTTNTVCNTYTTGPITTAIPDGGGANVQGPLVFIPITVTETTLITDVRISANVTHSYIGDLIMQLQTPNGGGFSNLWNRSCNDSQYGNIDITFKDGEAPIVCASPTAGTYAPTNPMTGFTGNNPSGTWELIFVDFFNGNTGVVNEWSIELCTTSATIITETLDLDSFEFNNFSLYPNPNNGDFSLAFNSNSGKDINVNIFDISGRIVYENIYDSKPNFNETIALENVSSGMYLIKVTDGDKTVTKKLIIK